MSELAVFSEIKKQKENNVLVVLTGPSGSGKDAILNELLKKRPLSTQKIITTTSRKMRAGEKEGSPYHFVSRERFEELISQEAFLEWVEFRGELYGTQKKAFFDALQAKKDCFWKIEAKGVKNIKDKIKKMIKRSVFVFVTAPSISMLRDRVFKAEGENAVLRWNESLVTWELKQYQDCDYLVVNDNNKLDEAVSKIQAIIEAKRCEIIPGE